MRAFPFLEPGGKGTRAHDARGGPSEERSGRGSGPPSRGRPHSARADGESAPSENFVPPLMAAPARALGISAGKRRIGRHPRVAANAGSHPNTGSSSGSRPWSPRLPRSPSSVPSPWLPALPPASSLPSAAASASRSSCTGSPSRGGSGGDSGGTVRLRRPTFSTPPSSPWVMTTRPASHARRRDVSAPMEPSLSRRTRSPLSPVKRGLQDKQDSGLG